MKGAGNYDQVLLSQTGSNIYSSKDEGKSFKTLCAMPKDKAAGVAGFANGVGLLSDGTLLAARYYMQHIVGTNLTRTATFVYTSKLPSSSDEVSFQWKNPNFLLKNPDFLLKNVDFIINSEHRWH